MKRPQFVSRYLRARLLLLVLIIIVPGALFVVVSDLRERDQRVNELLETNRHQTEELGQAVGAEIDAMRQLLVAVGESQDIVSANWGACNARMAAVLAQFAQYSNLGFADLEGRVRCSALANNGSIFVTDRDWFQRAIHTGRFAVGEYQQGRITGRASVNSALPVRDPASGVIGAVFVAYDLENLHDRIASNANNDAVVLVLDRDRVVLMREPDHRDWVGRNVSETDLVGLVGDERSGSMRTQGLDGVERRYHYLHVSTLDEGDLVAVRGVSEAPIIAATQAQMLRSTFAFLFVGAIAGGLAWWLSTHLILRHEETAARMAAVVDSSEDAIVSMTTEGIITSWNPAAERLFGYSANEAVGRPVDFLRAPGKGDQEPGLLRDVLAGRPVSHVETMRRRKDGSLVEVAISLTPIRDSRGVVVGVAGIARSIETQKAAQRELENARLIAEQTARSKSEFLANMSHEIRTPLNAVIGMTGLLLETKLSGEQREFAETIRASGEHLLTVINDILDISKIEAGAMRIDVRPMSVRHAVEEAFDLVAERAAQKRLELAYEIDPDVPVGIQADPTRLRQVLVNLLANAVKFTQAGEVTLHVSQEPVTEGPPMLHFAVRDTGMGIPADKLDRLFKPFSQVDSSTSRSQGGTGLGLAISRRLVELMGGRVWAESIQGRGSTFHFTIRAPVAHVVEPDTPQGTVPDLKQKRALIVDDNATNRRILALQAQSWGMQAREVASPIEALQILAGRDPCDVVLLDYSMPQMDGVALARHIRALAHRKHTPIVVLTSLGRRAEDDLSDLALAEYLTKPVRKSQLYNALVGTLRSHPEPEAPGLEAPRQTKRVLLAEDNAVNQRVAVKILERLGYRPLVVANGEEAVRAVESDGTDIILMDVQMPEVDGLEATRRIRARRPREKGPYIIAMTAHAMEGDREACLAAGMDDYLTKPIDSERLKEALSKVPGNSDGGLGPSWRRLREELGDEAVREIVETFRKETPALLAELRDGAKAREAKKVERSAHTLKSTAMTLGGDRLGSLCMELELAARGGDLKDVEAKVQAIEQEAQAFLDRLKDAQ